MKLEEFEINCDAVNVYFKECLAQGGMLDQKTLKEKKILESIGKRIPEYEIISCPTCGRTQADIQGTVNLLRMKFETLKFKKNIKIAVMGCIVNGPGEAKHADFGVAFGKDKSVIFKNGQKIKTINNKLILDELISIASEYYEK